MELKWNDPIHPLSINTIRVLSIDAIEKANSGHPGLPLGAAPMAYVLWAKHLRFHAKDPQWWNRDRFVLSAGHGSMLLYSLLHLTGYDLSLDEIKRFRQWGSKTPGHPEAFLTPGVEATTGPLGQGAANSVGMAVAERRLAHLFNKPGFELFNHFTYALVSDGDIMEGVCAEAASLAGQLNLGKLIWLYDANDVTLDGPTSLTFDRENVVKRFEAYGWQVLEVRDGDQDLNAIDQAIEAAKSEIKKPSLVVIKTTIGFGSPGKAGTSKVHGSPLGKSEHIATRKALGWPSDDSFYLPESSKSHFLKIGARSEANHQQWKALLKNYSTAHPKEFSDLNHAFGRTLPKQWDTGLKLDLAPGSKQATRKSSGTLIQSASQPISWLLGGDADLSCSTNTLIQNAGSFEGMTGSGRNIHYGVREHAMAAMANGMAYHGGILPFVATFFCFFDYMKPSVRLAAMNHLPVVYVWTHDSIALGEDGPTHQPIEHLMALRAIPNVCVLRPADAEETAEAWKVALSRTDGPTALILTRQDVPLLSKDSSVQLLSKGAYVVSKSRAPVDLILIATGSEVALALETKVLLEKSGKHVQVVSMPSFELFSKQDAAYRESVLPKNVRTRVSIEAGTTLGWERWVGMDGLKIGLDHFGASAPYEKLYEEFGFTAPAIASKILATF